MATDHNLPGPHDSHLSREKLAEAIVTLAADRVAGVTPEATYRRVTLALGVEHLEDDPLANAAGLANRQAHALEPSPEFRDLSISLDWSRSEHAWIATAGDTESLGISPTSAVEALHRALTDSENTGDADR